MDGSGAELRPHPVAVSLLPPAIPDPKPEESRGSKRTASVRRFRAPVLAQVPGQGRPGA